MLLLDGFFFLSSRGCAYLHARSSERLKKGMHWTKKCTNQMKSVM
jgi:hypothetical protein